jgi:hypothetical protein
MLLIRKVARPTDLVFALIQTLGQEIAAKVAIREEEIWICHYPQTVTVFAGVKRLLT